MLSMTQGGTGGLFSISAKSSNSDVSLSFPEAPVDSVQRIDAQTSNSRITVQMPTTFEGDFRLQTSNAAPSVETNNHAHNPAGVGRQRNVGYQQDKRGTTISGNAVWGEPAPGKAMGYFHAKSSNKDIRVIF
jgi:hypothetical protein